MRSILRDAGAPRIDTRGAAPTPGRGPPRRLLAMLPPLVALSVHWIVQDVFHPHVWFLFYPAVYSSAWIAGLAGGVLSSVFSVVLVLWLLLPTDPLALTPGQYLTAAILVATGVVFGLFHDRLRNALAKSEQERQEVDAAREHLRRTGESLAVLFDQAPDGIFVADLDGRYLDVNRSGCALLGYDREELLGKTIFDTILDSDADRLRDERVRLLAGGTVVSEWKLRRKDGSLAIVEVHARFVSDRRWQAVVRDLTARRRLEAELVASQERLDLALRAADLATWDWNLATDEVVFDARWAAMRGFRLDEIPGDSRARSAGIHPDDRPRVEQVLDAYLHDRIAEYDVEYRAQTKSGEWIWILDRGKLFTRDEHGRPVRMVGTQLDITARKHQQEEQELLAELGVVLATSIDLQTTLGSIAKIVTRSLADLCVVDLVDDDGTIRRVQALARDPAKQWICDVLMNTPVDRARAPDMWAEMEAGHAVLLQRVVPESFAQGEEQWHALHALGSTSLIVAPLFAHGRLHGTISFGAFAEGRIYTPADVRSFEQLAQRAAFALAKARLYEEARRAIEALEESEARFSHTIDEAPIGMAIVAFDGRFLRVNRALCEIVGYTAQELAGLTFHAIAHPEDLDHDLALAQQLARGEIPRYQVDNRFVRKSGTIVDVILSGSVVHDRSGDPIHLVVQVEDITDRKRHADEHRFLAEVAPVLASSLDYEETLARVAELAVRELADFCVIDLVDDDDEVRRLEVTARDPAKAWIARWIASHPPHRDWPYPLHEALDRERPVLVPQVSDELLASLAQTEDHLRVLRAAEIRSMLAVPLIARQRLLGGIAFASSSRSYEPHDLHLAEELGRRAAISIDNARLYRAAGEATHARDDVLGVVVHDLRNPLGNILMQVRLMARRLSDPARVKAGLETIERAASRMSRLIGDLLDVTRMEVGRLSLEQSRLPVAPIVREAFDAQRPLAAEAGVELRLELARDLPDVWADRDRLLQIFENLIGNALKFTKRGGVVAIGSDTNDREVRFYVTDTGTGIRPEDVPHVFDRFWQAAKSGRGGAGLGLPIVKGLVEAHGGRIWLESTPGRGTTVFVTIPKAGGVPPWQNESRQFDA